MDSRAVFSFLLEAPARNQRDLSLGTAVVHKKSGNKRKVRALKKKIDKEAQKKFQEILRLIKKAKAKGRAMVSLLMILTRGRAVPEREVTQAKKIILLLKRRKGLKAKLDTRSTSYQDSDESDDDSESFGAGFATYLVITGFKKY